MIFAKNNRDIRCDLLSDKTLPLTRGILFEVAEVVKWISWRINGREVVIDDVFFLYFAISFYKKKTFINQYWFKIDA